MAASNVDLLAKFAGKNILITGGLGFIGSNLAIRLVGLGADVTLVDSLIPQYGGNLFNIESIKDCVRVNIADVRDEHSMDYLVRGRDYLFNLAGQVSHTDSMSDPHTDLEINCHAQLSILEACRKYNPAVKIVFASTRQIYGKPDYLSVDEKHPLHPTDVNGINKMAGEWYHILYNNVYGVRTVSLRLTNTYGPRMRVKDARQTFLGLWIRQIVEGKPIEVFGDGTQLRDFKYVDDVVDALLLSAADNAVNGQVYNLGHQEVTSLRELAELMVQINGSGEYRLVPFPPERKVIDIGDYYADFSKFQQALGWSPRCRWPRASEGHSSTTDGTATTTGKGYDVGLRAGEVMIPVFDLRRQTVSIRAELDEAIRRVLSSGWDTLGQEVEAFEREFASWVGVSHCVSVGNGTDAIAVALRAVGVRPGDEVITVPNTVVATVAAIELAGARPVSVDVCPDTQLMDISRVEQAISPRTKAIVPVHLFGQAVDLDPLLELARRHGLVVVEDCAQAHGAIYKGKRVVSLGHAAAFSFYPTKNLGALGDGGAVATNDAAVADHARLIRQYGWRQRYISDVEGMNTRLDELQAAVLRVKLRHLDAWNAARRVRAAWYRDAIRTDKVDLPYERDYGESVYHLYVVRTSSRDALAAHLKARSIGTSVQYPVPIHLQPAYRRLAPPGALPVAERLAQQILSLPMYPELTEEEVHTVASAVNAFVAAAVA